MLYAFCEHTRPPRFFEFLSLILNAELRRDEGALHEYLHRFDHDGSGRISPVEFGRSACAHANDACPPHLSPSIVLYSQLNPKLLASTHMCVCGMCVTLLSHVSLLSITPL